jgi:nucleoside phosphorylase
VHVGPIASGHEDIVHAERAAQVRAATDALCVAWEGSGGARAARFNGIGFIEIRGITDTADEHAAAAFHANVRTVMLHVVDVILAWHAATRVCSECHRRSSRSISWRPRPTPPPRPR